MTASDALTLLRPGISSPSGTWADLGAGTGMFTLALRQLLERGTIYAVDKNPHVLWSIAGGGPVDVVVHEADFTHTLELPPLDGIVMANALHYVPDPVSALANILACLRPGAPFLLVEYETEQARPPWIPYPLPFRRFVEVALEAGLSQPKELERVASDYGHRYIYSAVAFLSPGNFPDSSPDRVQ
ncbi:MAG: class I SAM-dependent methyltransferase [Phaeodactylibacter sp.]|nr:class I SAM-dependent methyltransferase [Phaeodactylibacter sp.]